MITAVGTKKMAAVTLKQESHNMSGHDATEETANGSVVTGQPASAGTMATAAVLQSVPSRGSRQSRQLQLSLPTNHRRINGLSELANRRPHACSASLSIPDLELLPTLHMRLAHVRLTPLNRRRHLPLAQ